MQIFWRNVDGISEFFFVNFLFIHNLTCIIIINKLQLIWLQFDSVIFLNVLFSSDVKTGSSSGLQEFIVLPVQLSRLVCPSFALGSGDPTRVIHLTNLNLEFHRS